MTENDRKFEATTPNFKSEAAKKIAKLFPEVVADGQIDTDALEELLSPDLEDEEANEKYKFTWRGKRNAKRIADAPARTTTLIADKKSSKDWDATKNVYIEGDNLEVLKLMQKAYSEKVKVIYIDPPYNTGHDFVYKDKYHDPYDNYLRETGQIDAEGNVTTTNRESNGRFHTDWLNMMYPRLKLARNLLMDDGVIFISIDDNEDANLKKICDEIFGENNFLAQVVWERAYAPINLKKNFSESHDYILVYAKDASIVETRGIPRGDEADNRYSNPDNDPRGVWQSDNLSVGPAIESNIYPVTTPSGRVVEPPAGRSWRLSQKAFRERLKDNRIWFGSDGNGVPRMKRFLSELKKPGITPMTIWKYKEVGHSQEATQQLQKLMCGKKYFDYPKPVKLIQRAVQLYSENDSIILDFFSGSATTAQSVIEQNAEDGGHRKFIMVQLPEKTSKKSVAYKDDYKTIPEIAEERIRRAGKQIQEKHSDIKLDTGFKVFKLESSTIKQWDDNPDKFTEQLEMLHSPFTQDSTNDQRALEIAIKSGISLTASPEIDGDNYHFVSDDKEVFVILGKYDEKLLDELDKERKLPNATAVIREMDNGSETKFNLIEKMKQEPELNDHFSLEWL
ncbi:site-specific DNA-methyltransferase [Lactobacillus crispatus]|jgi:putative modification enzyme of type III restriction-modification system|uniref:site-specific DNA-methyltransferase n=2 Tax=Lactobacillus crispatus TaxID=47770 RepID=UPI0022ABEF25|nr:site-specific DNA-methyltransferase [Lactobacillus crispatus]MCZ3642639.1 site-specific DNA-methyltransferase [Lactobacillus crispatus]MCZ3645057.1 site-specific DNA-methyltransferase [Lactobacillus crispatus]MCZ3652232.1 site-specific DNA-methyltransferase [Lactobacillus crispatus]MCZ3654621.1 site-specific DNA-methyltransferase [Lactobacillus crispatus]MCZ3657032.1 site-specific DNA-methyltransferase [Lactobacillus crispatus]